MHSCFKIQSNLCKTANLSKRPKIVFKTNYRLVRVKSIAECSKGSILQYFQPSLSYQLSSRFLFCLFLSGRFTQILLLDTNSYSKCPKILKSFRSQMKYWFHNMLVRISNRDDPDQTAFSEAV